MYPPTSRAFVSGTEPIAAAAVTPGWQAVLNTTNGRFATAADTTPPTWCDNDGGTGCTGLAQGRLVVGPDGAGIDILDAAGVVITEPKNIYAASTWNIRVDNAGAQTNCIQVEDDGDVLFTTNENCRPAKSIWIPAAAMSISGTCTDTSPTERTIVTSGPKRFTIQPADGDTCSIEFDWKFPTEARWNAGTITVELVVFSTGNNTTEVFEMDFAGQCVRPGTDAVAAHVTTGEQAASVTFGAQANDERSSSTAAITLNGTCTAASHIYMRGQVDATATTVVPITDVNILGVNVVYRITQL